MRVYVSAYIVSRDIAFQVYLSLWESTVILQFTNVTKMCHSRADVACKMFEVQTFSREC